MGHPSILQLLAMIRPETRVRWHRAGPKIGNEPPRVDPADEIETPLWGSASNCRTLASPLCALEASDK